MLYSVFDCDQTYFLSDFTAAALISGYKNDEKEDKKEGDKEKDKENKKEEDEYSL